MSYSSQVKNQLASEIPTKPCCHSAFLSSILKVDGSIHLAEKQISLEAHTENSAIARTLKRLLSDFGLKANVTIRRSVLQGHTNYAVVIPVQEKLISILVELGLLDKKRHLVYGLPRKFFKKKCCRRSYLKGIFLGAGYLADPRQNYHLEIDIDNAQLAEDLVDTLASFYLKAHLSQRKNGQAIFLKNFEDIADFMALIGASKVVLDFQDLKILREIKNRVNRLVNCETANVGKVIKAAQMQIKDIATVDENIGIENLTVSLREIIRLRVEHPQASLVELANFSDPPLSKSAVNHRFRRIKKIAKAFLSTN